MKLLAALLAALLLAAPASARDLASESTYAANNPVKHTDRTGMLPDDSPGWDRLAAAQFGMSGGEKAAQGRLAVSMMPAAGDFIAAAISIGEAILSPSMANTETAGWDALGAALPFVPAVGTVKKVGDAAEAANDIGRKLPDNALVCRGGACTAERFSGGSGATLDEAGKLDGVSVTSAPGASLEGLTVGIPNKQVGVTTVGDVRAAGGDVIPSPTKTNPVHCTLCGVTPKKAEELFTPTVPNPNAR